MVEMAAQRERWRRIERDNDDGDDDDGDDDDGEKDDQKINSKSTFRPPQSRKGTITYSTCVLGVRLRYQRHGKCEKIRRGKLRWLTFTNQFYNLKSI